MRLMKGLRDLKKLSILFSILPLYLSAEYLPNYLSDYKLQILDYSDELNSLRSSILKKSWISPIMINYSDTKLSHSDRRDGESRIWSVSIDQPIFKSGGIYNAIKYAISKEKATKTTIDIQRRTLISQALESLYNIKKLKLQIKQAKLIIKNDEIDVKRKEEQYLAGLIDSSFLDQAILKRNSDKTKLLVLKLSLSEAIGGFSKLSDVNPDSLRLPKFSLVKRDKYLSKNIDIKELEYKTQALDYQSGATLSKYLPTISIVGQYSDEWHSLDLSPSNTNDGYYSYGFKISMPININSIEDVEASRVEYMKSAIELQDKIREVDIDYSTAIKRIRLIEKKIALAKSDAKLYRRLLKRTKEQVRAGSKTKYDVETMRNSMRAAIIDAKVYEIERQIALMNLYSKVGD